MGKDCFSGTDGVSWVAVHCRESRAQAVARLQGWLEAGLLARVGGVGPFEDDRNTYYQFRGGRSGGAAAGGGSGGGSGSSAALPAAALAAALPAVGGLPGATVLAAVAVSVARGRKRARPGHFLALCAAGPAQLSLRLGRAAGGGDGGGARVSNVWPLRAVLALDAEPGAAFVVRLRREGGSPLEYRFQVSRVGGLVDCAGCAHWLPGGGGGGARRVSGSGAGGGECADALHAQVQL